MTDVFVANRGKRHGAMVRRNYPRSRTKTLSSLLGNPGKRRTSKRHRLSRRIVSSRLGRRRAKKAQRDSSGRFLKSNPRKSRKRVHHKKVNSRVRHSGGTVKMARTRRRRRRNVWFDDKRGHKKAARKGWGRRKAKARRLRRQRLKALAKARSARRRKASVRKTTRKHRKAARSNPPRRRRRRRNVWPDHAKAHARAARKGWRRRKYGKRRTLRHRAKARRRRARRKVYSPSMLERERMGLGSGRLGNPRRRRHHRRNPVRRHRRAARRRNPVIGGALAIPRKLPLVGQFFNMPMIKAAGGIGIGILAAGGFGNMLYGFASSKLTFMADYSQIFRPICILAAGAGTAIVLSKLGWKNMSKYVILGAGAAVAVDLISPLFSTVMSKIPGMSDYVQMADYVQLNDQAAVERGMLGGYNDYVQLPGVSGLPGFSDQSAVEAGLL